MGHVVERPRQIAELVVSLDRDTVVEVALLDLELDVGYTGGGFDTGGLRSLR